MLTALPQQPFALESVKPFQHTRTGKIALPLAASLFVALCAHVTLPLPFTPVPLTLANFAVILVGMLLGPVAGFLAMITYLAEGAVGLPVFNPHGLGGVAQLLGPTAGYLFSYPLAAAIAGFAARIARTSSGRITRFAAAIVTGTAATVLILLSGASWFAHLFHISPAAALPFAVAPFLFGEAAKIVAAAGIFSASRRWLRA